MEFAIWVLPVLGVTLIVTCSTLFRRVREWLQQRFVFAYELLSCPMCFGFWAGALLATLGVSIPISDLRVLDVFLNGCAASWVCWTSHVLLCKAGQGKLLSARPDLK